MILESLRGHNEEEQYVEMEVYETRKDEALNFGISYIKGLIKKGELNIKELQVSGPYASLKPAKKGHRVYEVYYSEKA